MPYIPQADRQRYDHDLENLIKELDNVSWIEGHVNYVIFRLVNSWFDSEPRYHTIARIEGVLGNVAKEFYRKEAGPYEDEALLKNGDI